MSKNLKLVKIDPDYCDYLRRYDYRVAYNKNDKLLRPFIGVLFDVENMEYFAPLSSPKAKHLKMKNSIDFIKIDNGNLGVINFNNMIPVTKYNYELLDINSLGNNYYELLKSQLAWLNAHYIEVRKVSTKLYNYYNTGHLNGKIMSRCCDFKKLEKVCENYNKVYK